MSEWTLGYRIVPDGRIDLKPVSREHLANCMQLASVPEDEWRKWYDFNIPVEGN